jgi:hypothetical protein
MCLGFGVPYGSRTRIAAVKGNRLFIVIQRNFAAWIALYRTWRTHGNAYWTFNGPAFAMQGDRVPSVFRATDFKILERVPLSLTKRYEPVIYAL